MVQLLVVLFVRGNDRLFVPDVGGEESKDELFQPLGQLGLVLDFGPGPRLVEFYRVADSDDPLKHYHSLQEVLEAGDHHLFLEVELEEVEEGLLGPLAHEGPHDTADDGVRG